jgi:GNAT superfamily N-acetyltransferase
MRWDPDWHVSVMQLYSIREARPDEQRELTRLCVRATLHVGYDEAFIDRVMPGLTVTLPLINAGAVQVAQRYSDDVVGVVTVTTTMLQGIALLYGIFVDPRSWRRGVGRVLFAAAVARAKALKCGALMIYAEPSAEGFYRRMGAIRIGEGPFVYSPDVTLPHLLHIIPRE